MRLRATWRGTKPVQAGLVVSRKVANPLPTRIMVPGLFYGDNGLGSPSTRYPRLGPLDHERDEVLSGGDQGALRRDQGLEAQLVPPALGVLAARLVTRLPAG